MRPSLSFCLAALLAALMIRARAADSVFSGPQPGERTSGFKVAVMSADSAQKERDPVTENQSRPVTLVFLHALERSLVPLLRVIDEYGAQRHEQLRTEIIFLAGDRLAGLERMKAASQSLRLKSSVGLSLDGAEGPGNFGLNKECMMTIIVANENRVTANFALVQPGIADAPKVLAAMAKASGDASPPSAESLIANPPAAAMRPAGGQDPFPGAVPTDEKLNGLLRRFIRPNNDDATVDRLLGEVKAHLKDDPALKKQAIDGWTRILHFGDRYGTAHARKAGAEFLENLKKQ